MDLRSALKKKNWILILFIHFLTVLIGPKEYQRKLSGDQLKGHYVLAYLKMISRSGFARMITDKATFAYLADVFIIEEYRGRGLSKWLMEVIMSHPDLQGLRRMILATKDAHGLYKQFGFTPLINVDRWMHILDPDVYKR